MNFDQLTNIGMVSRRNENRVLNHLRYLLVVILANKPLLTFLLLITVIFHSNGQSNGETLKKINIAYFGKSVTRPGIKIGTDICEFSIKPRIKDRGDTISRRFILSSNIGYYYHFRNHHGLFLNSELGFRIIYHGGFFMQFDIGAGYLRTFLAARTYEVNSNGEIQKIPFAGSNKFMPGTGIILGKEFTGQKNKLKSIYCRVGGFMQYPYNTMWLPDLTLELGTTIKIR